MGHDEDSVAPRSSWLARAYHTPVSDALRGRLSGRLDARAEIEAAGLPRSLSVLVWEVVRQTRLWRSEKIEVARELVAHFADGVAAGRSTDELARDFGSTEQAARSIGKAKRRNRSWAWHTWYVTTRFALAALVLFIAAYAWISVRYYLGQPILARNYWLEINTARRAAESDRAWPLYRQSLVKLGRKDHGWIDTDKVARGPQHKSWNEAVALLERDREVLELLRRAAARPRLSYYLGDKEDVDISRAADAGWLIDAKMPPAEQNQSLIAAHLDGPQGLRSLARLLAVDARVAATEGDGSRTLEDLTAMIGMAGQLFEPRATLVEQLIGIAIFGFTMETSGRILADTPTVFSDDQLKTLAHRIAAFRNGATSVDFTGEQIMFEDALQRIYTDDGDGNGRITPAGMVLLNEYSDSASEVFKLCNPNHISDQGTRLASRLISPGVASFIGGRQENSHLYQELLDDMIVAHRGVPWQWDRRLIDENDARIKNAAGAGNRLRYYLVGLMLPALNAVFNAGERNIQYRDTGELTIALELWHRKHGTWPDRLDQLVPDLLPSVPTDRVDGQPLRYLVRDGRPLVYSIGDDRRDDGGQANRNDPEHAIVRTYGPASPNWKVSADDSGDWILWLPLPETIDEDEE